MLLREQLRLGFHIRPMGCCSISARVRILDAMPTKVHAHVNTCGLIPELSQLLGWAALHDVCDLRQELTKQLHRSQDHMQQQEIVAATALDSDSDKFALRRACLAVRHPHTRPAIVRLSFQTHAWKTNCLHNKWLRRCISGFVFKNCLSHM